MAAFVFEKTREEWINDSLLGMPGMLLFRSHFCLNCWIKEKVKIELFVDEATFSA